MKIEGIKKRLLSSEFTAYEISKETGIAMSTIYELRNGKRNFDNLTVKVIKELEHFFEMNKPIFKLKLKKNIQGVVIEDSTTVKSIVDITAYDSKVFIEEVEYFGNVLVISVINTNERVRRYAVRTQDVLKNTDILTKNKKEDWHVASVKELQDAGMNVY